VIAFKGRNPIRSKIVKYDKIVEQVNSFHYSGNLVFYEKEVNIDSKLNNHLKITGIINSVFRTQKTLKKTRIKLYNTLAVPGFLNGSENWTIKRRNTRRITAAGMKYVRKTAGYAWTDHKKHRYCKRTKPNPRFG